MKDASTATLCQAYISQYSSPHSSCDRGGWDNWDSYDVALYESEEDFREGGDPIETRSIDPESEFVDVPDGPQTISRYTDEYDDDRCKAAVDELVASAREMGYTGVLIKYEDGRREVRTSRAVEVSA